MADVNQEYPYKMLGGRLKGMREKHRESVAEVSGAVEIEVDTLAAIERGADRPSEDILLLLISHFAVKEDEASKLWELAGYDKSETSITSMTIDELGSMKNTIMVMPMDVRVSYTDMAHVVVNDHGVVLNFMQTSGPNNQPLVVSRLGMSREHAETVIDLLQKTLAQHKQQSNKKALPPPKADKNSDNLNSDK